MNRSQLDARILDFLNRSTLSQAALDAFVENAEGMMNRTLEHPKMLQRVDLTLPEDTSIVALPADILQLLTVRINNKVMRQYPSTMVEQLAAGNLVGYIVRGDCIEFFPMLGAGTAVYLDYRAAIPSLVGGTVTENWVSRTFPDVYLYGCLIEAAVYLKDDQRLQLWSQKLASVIETLNGQGWGQNIANAPRVKLA